LATDIDPHSDRGVINVSIEGDDEPLKLLRAVAIYGPNASGKSTVLRAASALRYLISTTRRLRSEERLRPYEPFALKEKEPVRLGVKAAVNHRVYDYEVRFDRTHFLSERLLWLKPDGDPILLLDRQDRKADGEWMRDERFALLAKDFRRNAL